MGVDEAQQILETILSVDPETIISLDDFSKFVGLPDAITAIAFDLLSRMQVSEGNISSLNYIDWDENNTDNHHHLQLPQLLILAYSHP